MAGLSDLVSSIYQKGKSTYDSAKNWTIDASNKIEVTNAKSNLKKYIKGECPAGFIILNGGSFRNEKLEYSNKYKIEKEYGEKVIWITGDYYPVFKVEGSLSTIITIQIGDLYSPIAIKREAIEKVLEKGKELSAKFFEFAPKNLKNKVVNSLGIWKNPDRYENIGNKYCGYYYLKLKDEATINIKLRGIEKKNSGIYELSFYFSSYTYNSEHYDSFVDTKSVYSIDIPATDVAEEYMQELENRTKAVKKLEDVTIKAGADPSKVMTLDYSSEEALDKSVGSIVPGIPVLKPTDESKKETLSTPADPSRTPPEKITVMGSNKASVMHTKLSQENLEQGSNRKDTYYYDKRPGNAKLGDIYGMQTKLDAPGCIKLYKTDGGNGYQEPVTIDCFLLQSVQTSLKEKFSIFQSLSGDVLAYFFGKQPVVYRFSAALYNTYNQEWGHDFRNYYETYLRGSASIGKNIRTVVSYENHVIEGFFLEMNMQESATNTNLINIDFSILFIQDTILNYNAPTFSVLDNEPEPQGMMRFVQNQDVSPAAIPENFSVTRPDGDETITLANDALIRSTPDNLPDNKLKTIKAGEQIIIDNDVLYGKDGSEWYAVKGGKYVDGERISTNNKAYIRKSDARGNVTEEAIANKKEFDPKQPDAPVVKAKSDMKAGTKETDQLKKVVEKANSKSQTYNSHLNASAKKDSTKIYEAASSKSPVLGTINKGEQCETLKNEG